MMGAIWFVSVLMVVDNKDLVDRHTKMRDKVNRMLAKLRQSPQLHPTSSEPPIVQHVHSNSGVHNKDVQIIEVVKETGWDGVRYLGQSEKKSTRLMWMIIIILFIILSSIQIYFQVKQYMDEPVSTNIEVEYPQKIALPTIAICNNNQFRLSHLVKEMNLLKSRSPIQNSSMKSVDLMSVNPFDQVLIKNSDQDAVSFLNKASHQLEDLVMRCVLPDGTACNSTHFEPFWTVDGLCWAFNSDRFNPREVPGSGTSYGLRLLLNLESYERIESKHKHFRSNSLPGVTIIVFNQTDVPHSTSNGIDIPPGFTSYLPLDIQKLTKLPRSGCQKESDVSKMAYDDDFLSPVNIRSCKIRKYLEIIEKECSCSMKGMFNHNLRGAPRNTTKINFPPCTVDEYFGCVTDIVRQISDSGAASKCLPPCESLEFTGPQNLNRIPKNLMPIEQDNISDYEIQRLRRVSTEVDSIGTLPETNQPNYDYDSGVILNSNVQYVSISEPLEEQLGKSIKKKASSAIESQHKYQDDIAARFRKLIRNMSHAKLRLFAAKWGWHNSAFKNVYARITEKHGCVKAILTEYKGIESFLTNPNSRSEEKKTEIMLMIIDPEEWKRNPSRFKTTMELRNHYKEKAELRYKERKLVEQMSKEMWSVINEITYTQTIIADLSMMDIIVSKAVNLENFEGLKEWADEMNSADKLFFMNEELSEGWYKLIYDDLDKKMVKTIKNVFLNHWPKLREFRRNGADVYRTAATIYYGRMPEPANITRAENFFNEMEKCLTEVNGTAVEMLDEFKGLYKKFTDACTNLFKKELKKVQEKFEFGEDFELQNFAMVNIYLNKMAIEKWSQEETYSFWSLASDVGGALGLFMGASLVSIIEILIIGFSFGGKFFSRKVSRTVRVVEDYRERKRSRAPAKSVSIDMTHASADANDL